jgi:hypothetical protein
MDQISLWVEEAPYKREQITLILSNAVQKYNKKGLHPTHSSLPLY